MNGVFIVGGRSYPLRFTVNHICCLEEATKKPLSALLDGSLQGVRDILWCGLMAENITREDAGQIMQDYLDQGGSFADLSQILADAMADAGFFRQSVPAP